MRIRVLLATAAVALVTVVGLPGSAQAEPAGEAEEECIELLEDGKAIDDCQEAPSPILPETNEILWGGAAFLILLVALWKFALPPVRQMMQNREDRIRADLERAEQAKNEGESELAEYRKQLADARNEAGRIIEEARQSADQVRRDLVARAEAEAAGIRDRAQQDVRLATDRATADLQSRVAELTIELAEKVVERNLDHDTQIALIESYINEVGNGQR
ncbi:MAG: F0F1 ATP synthase subunit B [Acidimicrobiia bacterium]|jgi:F-type H+-transporting ATPase subunit b